MHVLRKHSLDAKLLIISFRTLLVAFILNQSSHKLYLIVLQVTPRNEIYRTTTFDFFLTVRISRQNQTLRLKSMASLVCRLSGSGKEH